MMIMYPRPLIYTFLFRIRTIHANSLVTTSSKSIDDESNNDFDDGNSVGTTYSDDNMNGPPKNILKLGYLNLLIPMLPKLYVG